MASEKNDIIEEKSITNVCSIILFNNGIIEIGWNKELKEINKSHLVALKEIIKKFGKSKKMPVYISTFDFMIISEEGRRYSASSEGQEFTLANAVLIDNLAKKLMFNFFLNINQPTTPTKAFNTKEEAITWLLHQ
jgi:hypothetical protein